MSLYNLIFGQNPLSHVLLAMLGLTEADVGRFRDAAITNGKIAIYTRLGGENRECWCEGDKHYCYVENIEKLQSNPYYLYDEDDEFDNTYATFYFRFPEEYAELLAKLETGEPFNPSEK